jgi:hypothetical protein BACCOPRO_02360
MIDFEFFDKYLNKEEKGFIDNTDKITLEVINYLKKYKRPQWLKLFVKTGNRIKGEPLYLYRVEKICNCCNLIHETLMTKTVLFEYLEKGSKFICEKCVSKLKEEQIEKEQEKEVREKDKTQNTKNYIEIFLNPNRSWNKGICLYEKMRYICNQNINDELVSEYINDLDYYEFLKTPYWKAIAQNVKQKSKYKCELCNSSEYLVAHHKTYSRHGYEHLYWNEDLICLCSECHEKFHFE